MLHGDMASEKRSSPSALRNRGPILEVLARVLPSSAKRPLRVLELASGSGEHAVWFARALPDVAWQPTDLDPAARASVDAWVTEEALSNVAPALALDATASTWPVEETDAVICINMIHISPWAACEGLMRGAARVLSAGGVLFLYGPFAVHGSHTAPSNAAFDADLRGRNAEWGVRNLDEVIALAAQQGLAHAETVAMPANNLSVVLRRA